MAEFKKVLIVDDSEENRSILERFLLHLGLQVDLCRNGMEALSKLRDTEYAMIFTDVNMPEMTGIELLDTLRKERDETPVVMVTGYPTITLAVESIKKGATDFITKPFNLIHLEHVVTRIIKEKNLEVANRDLTEELREKSRIEELNNQLQKKIEELSLLYSISEMANFSDDMEELFDKIVEMASIITRGKEISLFLYDRDDDMLVPKRLRESRHRMEPIPAGEGLVGRSVQEKRSMMVNPGRASDVSIPHTSRCPFLTLPMIIKGEVFGVLNISKENPDGVFSAKELQLLNNMIAKCSLSLENHALYEGFYDNLTDTLRSLIMAVEAKDLYTKNHSQRVTDLSILIAREMGRPRSELETLRFAGFIHDIGKIGIQDTVLQKPGRLTEAEAAIIRTHPVLGENIVRPLKFLKEEQLIVRHHHERYDGSGYPDGLSGQEIPLLARILSVADTYDAITSTRPYRTARRHLFAIEEIKRCKGSQFDPEVVEAFLACLDSYRDPEGAGGFRWEKIQEEVRGLF